MSRPSTRRAANSTIAPVYWLDHPAHPQLTATYRVWMPVNWRGATGDERTASVALLLHV